MRYKPSPDDAANPDFWLGTFAMLAALAVRGEVDRRTLEGYVAAFLDSPVCDAELRRLLLRK